MDSNTPINVKAGSTEIYLKTREALLDYIKVWKMIASEGIRCYDQRYYLGKYPKNSDLDKFAGFQDERNLTCLKLLQNELEIVDALLKTGDEHYHNYMQIQEDLCKELLYGEDNRFDAVTKLSELEKIAVKSVAAANCQQQKNTILTDNRFLSTHNNKKVADKLLFRRFYLFQKQQFISYVEAQINMAIFFSVDSQTGKPVHNQLDQDVIEKLEVLLLNNSDLKYKEVDAVFLMPLPVASKAEDAELMPDMLMLGNKPIVVDPVVIATKQTYDTSNEKLKDITAKFFSKKLDVNDKNFYKEYKKFSFERDALNDVINYSRNQIIALDKTGKISEQFIEKKDNEKLKELKEVGEKMATTALLAAGKLAINALNGVKKEENYEIIEELAIDLALMGTSAAVGLVFGPIGASLTSDLLSFALKKPKDDPYLKEFKALNDKLDEKFNNLDIKLDEMQKQISAELLAVVKEIKNAIEHQGKQGNFDAKCTALNSLLKDMDESYQNIFSNQQNTVEAQKLVNLDNNIRTTITELVSIFYHERYTIGNIFQGNPSEKTIAYNLIAANKQAIFSFHETCNALMTTSLEIFQLVRRYERLRVKWFSSLAAAMVVFDNDPQYSREKIFKFLLANYPKREEFGVALLNDMYLLNGVVIGYNNIKLNGIIHLALQDPKRFNFLCAFGLATDDDNKQFGYEFEINNLLGKGEFSEKRQMSVPNRYYIATYTPKESVIKPSYYIAYSFQNNEVPMPMKLLISLGNNDTVNIKNLPEEKDIKARAFFPDVSSMFAGSLEQYLLTNKAIRLYGMTSNEAVTIKLPTSPWLLAFNYVLKKTENTDNYVCHATISTVNPNNKEAQSREINIQFDLNQRMPADINVQEQENSGCKLGFEQNAYSAAIRIKACHGTRTGERLFTLWDRNPRDVCENAILPGISTFRLVCFQGVGSLQHIVPSENLRPFVSNLLLTKQQFSCVVDEVEHFGSIVDRKRVDCRSRNGFYSLDFDLSNGWDTRLVVREGQNKENVGSVFKNYEFRNKYSVYCEMQADGNFVMYDYGTGNHAIAHSGTYSKEYHNAYGFLADNGSFNIISKPSKDTEIKVSADKFQAFEMNPCKKPVFTYDKPNRLVAGQVMKINDRLVSENGKYEVVFECFLPTGVLKMFKKTEFALTLRPKEGKLVKLLTHELSIDFESHQHLFRVEMQDDGNLVMYQKKICGDLENPVLMDIAMTSTNTSKNPGLSLCLSNDGTVFLGFQDKREIFKILYPK